MPGEVTQAVRDSIAECGPIAAGDWIAITRDGICVATKSAADAAIALLDELIDDDSEIVTVVDRRRGRSPTTRRGSPSTSGSRTPTSSSSCTTVASRSTRTSSASSSSATRWRPGLTLRELAAHGVAELKAVGPKLETGLADMGITSVLDLLEHYPRRYVDRTERAEIAELVDRRRGHRRRRGALDPRRGARATASARSSTRVVYDGTGLLELVFFNQAWRERQLSVGTQVSLFGKVEQYRGKRQMTNPVVDVLARPTPSAAPATGRTSPARSCPSTRNRGRPRCTRGSCGARSRRRCSARRRGASPTRSTAPVRAELGLVDRTRAYTNIHRPETMQRRVRSPRTG